MPGAFSSPISEAEKLKSFCGDQRSPMPYSTSLPKSDSSLKPMLLFNANSPIFSPSPTSRSVSGTSTLTEWFMTFRRRLTSVVNPERNVSLSSICRVKPEAKVVRTSPAGKRTNDPDNVLRKLAVCDRLSDRSGARNRRLLPKPSANGLAVPPSTAARSAAKSTFRFERVSLATRE